MNSEEQDSMHIAELSNGTKLHFLPIKGLKSACFGLGYEAGGCFEEGTGRGSNSGISHFLEHMIFTGTSKTNNEQTKQNFARIHSYSTAYTRGEKTVYLSKSAKNKFDQALELWGELITDAEINPETFEKERLVVKQEEKLVRDKPAFHVYVNLRKLVFQNTQLEQTTIGDPDSLSNMSVAMMKDYVNRYYTPDNSLLAVIGDFNFEEIHPILENTLGKYERDKKVSKPRINPWKSLPSNWKAKHKLVVEEAKNPHTYIGIAWAYKEDMKKIGYPLYLLNTLIGNSKASLLYENIISKGINSRIMYYYEMYPNVYTGMLILSSSPKKAGTTYGLITEKVIEELKQTEITDDLLERLKREHLGNLALRYEDLLSLASYQISRYMTLREDISLEQYNSNIRSVTRQDLQELINKVFDNQKLTTFAYGDIPESLKVLK